MKKGFIIAIDGPLASGKGTIAKKLAEVLHGMHLNTGAMYRGLALFCIKNGINVSDPSVVTAQLENIHIVLRDDRIELNGEDVTEAILHSNIAEAASVIGTIPQVRKKLVQKQQEIGRVAVNEGKIVIAEGRDTGTAVFPDAAVKIYLTASEEIRAERRLAQMHPAAKTVTFAQVLEQVISRDQRDTKRTTDPLTSNPVKDGYTIVDNSDFTLEQTVTEIENILKKRNVHND